MYDQQLPAYPGYPAMQSDARPMPMPTMSQNQLRNNSDVSPFSGMLRCKTSDDLQAILHNESKVISMIGEVGQVSTGIVHVRYS